MAGEEGKVSRNPDLWTPGTPLGKEDSPAWEEKMVPPGVFL